MKSRTASGFDQLAPIYGRLSKLVFGNSISQSQECFLSLINSRDRILILGGGSGEFLKSLLQKHPHVTIDYIDLSPRMIDLAKKRSGNLSNVNFIIGTEDTIPAHTYSVVITNFYLDLFIDKTLDRVIAQIKPHLATNVTWLATDFISEKPWHKFFTKVMYAFFRVVTRIEANTLPDWQSALKNAGLQQITSQNFYRGFIKSSVYKRVV